MPPKKKYSREDIISVAYELAKERGLSHITARNVAQQLGSSVAPIYVNFETIDDLITAVVERIFALSQELLLKQKGPDLFANIGKASLAFAREHPVFFRELVMKANPYMASYETIEDGLLESLSEEERMGDLTHSERRRLFLKMRIFQMGLSVMAANQLAPSYLTDEAMEELLLEVGEDLLAIEKMKKEREK